MICQTGVLFLGYPVLMKIHACIFSGVGVKFMNVKTAN